MKFLFPLAKRFIAGHDFDSAKPVINDLILDGYHVSVDYLGELSKTEKDCHKAYEQYVEIIRYYKSIEKPIDISIKPSQMGLNRYDAFCSQYMDDLVNLAKSSNITVRLDMEDYSLVEKTINLCLTLRQKYDNVGLAIQSNLVRTGKDIHMMFKNKVSMRLVKGAYTGDEKQYYQFNKQIKRVFTKQALQLLAERYRSKYFLSNTDTPTPAIATHDEDILFEILHYLEPLNLEKYDFYLEFLYGIRRDLSSNLKKQGYKVRLYVPFGEEWLPYTLRRLKEFKNLKFVIFNVFKEFFKKNTS